MKIEGKEYRTIWFDEKSQTVKIIDQTKLPHQFIIKDLKTVKDAINAIKIMEVRGAPLIGGTAAYGIVLAIMEKNDPNFIKKSSEDLIKSYQKGCKQSPIRSLPLALQSGFLLQRRSLLKSSNPHLNLD